MPIGEPGRPASPRTPSQPAGGGGGEEEEEEAGRGVSDNIQSLTMIRWGSLTVAKNAGKKYPFNF